MDSDYYYDKTNMGGNNNMNCFETLKNRGYIYQLTHEEEIKKLLNGKPITFYLGIDPTADSLHIGHFFALTMARWLQEFGHRAIILVGGATALIGDPTGKSDMRSMLTKEQVMHNKKEVKELVKRFVKEDTLIVDNDEWFKGREYIDFMRDVGIHFNVNKMLATDIYKNRLQNGGLTFLEMGYMLMQAFDFTILKDNYDCILQIGGSDQWANIVAGVDLGRKLNNKDNKEVELLFGLTCPLLVKADGEKMGKTSSGTLWVSREKTDSYDFYQAFVNSFDEDVERLLSFFTRIGVEEIKKMCNDDIVSAKKIMAYEVTKLVHGEEEANKVRKIADDIFNGLGVSENMPSFTIENFDTMNVLDFLLAIKLVSSKNEAKRLIEQNGISINKIKINNIDMIIRNSNFKNNELIVQKGKKIFLKVKIYIGDDKMKNHDMRLHAEPFEMIESGVKDIEYRLNDDKRKKIKVGDTITFYKRPEETEIIKVLVTDLKYYNNLLEMYTATFEKDFKNKYKNPQEVVDDTPYYTDEEIKNDGCVAIYFKKIKK